MPLNMAQYLRDQWWVLDASDHSELAAAFRASLDVDGEDPLEALHPTHGRHGFVTIHRALRTLRYDAFAMLEVWCEHPVEASEVQSWAWDQCGQAGNKIQRFQHDMGRSIPEGIFVAVYHPSLVIDTEAFSGYGWIGKKDVAQQAIAYGDVYVARVAYGSFAAYRLSMQQKLKREASRKEAGIE